ncbi:DUF302 domain-containing protein [Mycolicibacterium mengxianglii]|uniref:DUF302 domain-containing protein n=1 Tax=Mycolicibacterium mengxianglii TaxID=2736649 RepID=UPI0018D179A1|nr:DUF302 domain-containing protein [Mycolicibacterium mengxianglii]
MADNAATTVEHLARRLTVVVPGSYDDVRTRYELLVPVVDYVAFAAAHSWDEALMAAEDSAPYGFMRYYRGDVSAVMRGSSAPWNATQYLMGNHVIAERMFRHDPAVMLHAPLRTLIYTDSEGDTRFAVDQPSTLFASYGIDAITVVGQYLDELLARLLALLGAEVPALLQPRAAPPRLGTLTARRAPAQAVRATM